MPELSPGGELAVDAGCRCPVDENQHGHAWARVIRDDCPLHGRQVDPLRLKPGDRVVFPDESER